MATLVYALLFCCVLVFADKDANSTDNSTSPDHYEETDSKVHFGIGSGYLEDPLWGFSSAGYGINTGHGSPAHGSPSHPQYPQHHSYPPNPHQGYPSYDKGPDYAWYPNVGYPHKPDYPPHPSYPSYPPTPHPGYPQPSHPSYPPHQPSHPSYPPRPSHPSYPPAPAPQPHPGYPQPGYPSHPPQPAPQPRPPHHGGSYGRPYGGSQGYGSSLKGYENSFPAGFFSKPFEGLDGGVSGFAAGGIGREFGGSRNFGGQGGHFQNVPGFASYAPTRPHPY